MVKDSLHSVQIVKHGVLLPVLYRVMNARTSLKHLSQREKSSKAGRTSLTQSSKLSIYFREKGDSIKSMHITDL